LRELVIQEPNGDFPLRPQLHVLLLSPPGNFKSTILRQVGEHYGVTPYSNATYAAMIGTIDQLTKQPIPGIIWDCRNRPLLIDEFETAKSGDKASALDVLLAALEDQRCKRKTAAFCAPRDEKEGDLFYSVKDGTIEVKTRFAAIIATMRHWERNRSPKIEAIVQRCVPIWYEPDNELCDRILDGERIYEPEEYQVPERAVISRGAYETIRKVAEEYRDRNPDFSRVYARAVGDMCRAYAVVGRHDTALYGLICALKDGRKLQMIRKLGSEANQVS